MDELVAFRDEVARRGGSTAEADRLVERIALSENEALLPPLFARLDAASDQLGWFRDCDYAAVALQAALAQASSPSIHNAMLGFALERARWCASCATAGGEGLARSIHVHELEAVARK
ncbi:hypothetical protein [Roseateles cavernae]|uniref:hypothetical protein n=1 Tax=Roseateles cavernae TaxID=3153578 RepID=UPI0032E48F6F